MKRPLVALALALPLTVGSCAQDRPLRQSGSGEVSATMLSPDSAPITETCKPGDDVGGFIRIVLPKRLVFKEATSSDPALPKRKVFTRQRPAGETTVDEGSDEDDRIVGERDNDPDDPANKREPFHVFLGKAGFTNPTKQYVAIRVIIPADADYAFYPHLKRDDDVDPRYFAVAYGKGKSQLLKGQLCRAPTPEIKQIPVAGATRPKLVYRFYLDTQGLDKKAPYLGGINILLQPYASPETLIVIDPKMRNEG